MPTDSEVRRRLRLAYDEWADNQSGNRPEPAIHRQWLRFVLQEVLELLPDTIPEGQQIPTELRYVRLFGNTKGIEENFERWVFGMHWKQHPRSPSTASRDALVSG